MRRGSAAGRDVEAEEAATDAPSRQRGPPPPLLPPTEVGAEGPTHRPGGGGGGGGWVGDWGVGIGFGEEGFRDWVFMLY
jgi:hypothetical protein